VGIVRVQHILYLHLSSVMTYLIATLV